MVSLLPIASVAPCSTVTAALSDRSPLASVSLPLSTCTVAAAEPALRELSPLLVSVPVPRPASTWPSISA